MSDEPFYAEAQATAPQVGSPAELFSEFFRARDDKFFRCELRDHEQYGGEAQFFEGGEFFLGRRFYPSLDPTRSPRTMAIQWAEQDRKAIEASR